MSLQYFWLIPHGCKNPAASPAITTLFQAKKDSMKRNYLPGFPRISVAKTSQEPFPPLETMLSSY